MTTKDKLTAWAEKQPSGAWDIGVFGKKSKLSKEEVCALFDECFTDSLEWRRIDYVIIKQEVSKADKGLISWFTNRKLSGEFRFDSCQTGELSTLIPMHLGILRRYADREFAEPYRDRLRAIMAHYG